MTSTASPGVERALAVLQFIADHEPRRFTASQLSELLRLNRGTCQSLLAALEIHGCVSRSPSGTFGLGQTLRFWSEQVAPEAFAAGRRIGGALQAFAERHSSRIGIAALIGDEIVVTENHAPPQHAGGDPGPPVAAGLRVPWVPPFGVVFAAFAATEDRERWLGALPADGAPGLRADHERLLRTVGERGFDLLFGGTPRAALEDVLTGLPGHVGDDEINAVIANAYRHHSLDISDDVAPSTERGGPRVRVPIPASGEMLMLVAGPFPMVLDDARTAEVVDEVRHLADIAAGEERSNRSQDAKPRRPADPVPTGVPLSRRPTPAVERAIRILNHLAERRAEGHTALSIAQALGLNRGSVQSALTELSTRDFVRRDPIRSQYSLGGALITIAQAVPDLLQEALGFVREQFPQLLQGRAHAALASALVDDKIVVLARTFDTGAATRRRGPFIIGQGAPYRAPFGTVFAAFRARAEWDTWIDSMGDATEGTRQRYRSLLSAVRDDGFHVSYVTDERAMLIDQYVGILPSVDDRWRPASIEDDIGGPSDGVRPVRSITAPVFGPSGEVVLVVTLEAFTETLDERAIAQECARLVEWTEHVTSSLHGWCPDDVALEARSAP